jgi:hypothetical protein
VPTDTGRVTIIVLNGIHYEVFPATDEGVKAANEFAEPRAKFYLVEPYMRKTSDGTLEETLTSRRILGEWNQDAVERETARPTSL